MSDERLRAVESLDQSMLEPEEYAALAWVRETLTRPGGVSRFTADAFHSLFSPAERKYVASAAQGMLFVNLCVNTLHALAGGSGDKTHSCPL